jgi:hypothetical protein
MFRDIPLLRAPGLYQDLSYLDGVEWHSKPIQRYALQIDNRSCHNRSSTRGTVKSIYVPKIGVSRGIRISVKFTKACSHDMLSPTLYIDAVTVAGKR